MSPEMVRFICASCFLVYLIEQLTGMPFGTASDVFSFGITACEVLSRKLTSATVFKVRGISSKMYATQEGIETTSSFCY